MTDGERLAIVETQINTLTGKINSVENSIQSLHGKVDTFTKIITENYVAISTFNEWKRNRWLERILTILVTAVIMALVGFFMRENKF